MGTSGAYGGSPGWSDTRRDTDAWLGSRTNEGGNDPTGSDPVETEDPQQDIPVGNQPTYLEDPLLIRLLRRVARHLSEASLGSGAGGSSGGSGGGAGNAGSQGGRSRAAISGGVAIAGTYGLRNGSADAVSDAGLSLVDLLALTPFEQARRIVDAASGPSALVEDAELREVNANFVYWAIQQESPPSPMELVRQWMT